MLLACSKKGGGSAGPDQEDDGNGKDEDKRPELVILSADVLFDAEGGFGNIHTSSGGREIAVFSLAEWISTAVDGNHVSFLVGRNLTEEVRVGQIEISCERQSLTVSVEQLYSEIVITPSQLTVPAQGGSYPLTVDGGIVFTVQPEVDWINVRYTPEAVLDISQTDIFISRLYPVPVRLDNGMTKTVIVRQDGIVSPYPDTSAPPVCGDFLVGSWLMRSNDSKGEANPEKRIEITESADGSYKVTGLEYPFNLNYNGGEAVIYAGQPVATAGSEVIYLCCYDLGKRSYTTDTNEALRAVPQIEADKITMVFEGQSDRDKFNAHGFVFWRYDHEPLPENSLGSAEGALRYFDVAISLTKDR